MKGQFCISANDVCLAGHFPGNPIVPGVVMLSRIEKIAEKHVRRVKFVKPLLPEQQCIVNIADNAFSCCVDELVIAKGYF